ncbi:MAG: hypothetical protein U0360_06995 [Dehalococcoidia bacterium]
MRRSSARRWMLAIGVWAATALLWTALLLHRGWLSSPRDFDPVTFELTALPSKWLHALGTSRRGQPAPDVVLATFFTSTDRRSPAMRALEPEVAAALDIRIDAALRRLGVRSAVGVGVWPPVSTALTQPPAILASSPRDRIRLLSARPIDGGITGAAAADLEREVDASSTNRVSLVAPLGGISTYPAIVTDDSSYTSTVQVAAHEWVHHYLAFTELGLRTLVSREALTINETVSDIAGSEIAAQVLSMSGTPEGGAPRVETAEAARARSEGDAALRDLRREVDALLAAGEVDRAEARMEEVRVDLAARGTRIRKINQAFFAWYGTYTARPDSIDPLGGQIRELRRAAGSLPRFLDVVGGASSRAEIAARLTELQRSP